MIIEKKINNYIKDNHINKTVLAGEMKIKLNHLEKLLDGKEEITTDEFINFCNALNTDPNTIYSYRD